jgi:hypothetical protein
MARTLQQLKESVERLIEQQGKDAPVAAFIFTSEDVFETDDDTLEHHHLPLEDAEKILDELDGFDYIYEKVFGCMEDDILRLKNRVTP